MLSWVKGLLANWPKNIEAKLERLKANLFATDLAEARERVLQRFEQGDPFQASRRMFSGAKAAEVAKLASGSKELLTRFSELHAGGMRMSRDDLAPVQGRPGHWVTGLDTEHAVIVAAENDERVWVLEPRDLTSGQWPDPYPSVWHYLLLVAVTSKPGWWRHDLWRPENSA